MAIKRIDLEYVDRPERAPICIELHGSPDDPSCSVWVDDGIVPFIRSSQKVRDALVEVYRLELQRIAGIQ